MEKVLVNAVDITQEQLVLFNCPLWLQLEVFMVISKDFPVPILYLNCLPQLWEYQFCSVFAGIMV
jgi:hypothetical protein